MELNREIFDIDDCEMETNLENPDNPDIQIAEFQESDVVEIQKNPKNVDAEELIQVLEDHKESKIELVLEPASSSCTVSKNLLPPESKKIREIELFLYFTRFFCLLFIIYLLEKNPREIQFHEIFFLWKKCQILALTFLSGIIKLF